MRLDAYLAQYWPEKSRSTWAKLVKSGKVRVNGETVEITKYKLGEDDAVTVDTLPVLDFSKDTLPVVYEDEHVLVINKPSGILTHAKGVAIEEFTVADFVRGRMTEPDETNRPGIVHRLDRATSGIIICAKDAMAKRLLQKQFQDRKAYKTYLAIVDGTLKLDEAKINLPIERNPKKPSQFRVGASGKAAVTSYKVLATNEKYSVVELKPLTGRTHQLRVHLEYLHHPIVGDVVYTGSKSPIGRMCLHARELEITIPTSQRRTFTADVPEDFAKLAREIGYDI